MTQMQKRMIPSYYLYGEQVSDVELDFLHVEPIRDRSGANDWTIPPHAHPDHVQILLVEHGGGEIEIEGIRYAIPAPSLIVIPSAMVHSIDFQPSTDGYVVNAARAYCTSLAPGDTRVSEAIATPEVYGMAPEDPNLAALRSNFAAMHREYIWTAPGRRLAILSHCQRIMVALLRLREARGAIAPREHDRDYDILCRYREAVEQHFPVQKGLDFYANALGLSTQRLNLACKARAGRTASELLHERILVEAKRCLIYREMTVAEVGYHLGYDDPSYFSRFFSQRVGQPPGAYRDARLAERMTERQDA